VRRVFGIGKDHTGYCRHRLGADESERKNLPDSHAAVVAPARCQKACARRLQGAERLDGLFPPWRPYARAPSTSAPLPAATRSNSSRRHPLDTFGRPSI